jgi:hypothetical protein
MLSKLLSLIFVISSSEAVANISQNIGEGWI